MSTAFTVSAKLLEYAHTETQLSSIINEHAPWHLLFLEVSLGTDVLNACYFISYNGNGSRGSISFPHTLFILVTFVAQPSPLLWTTAIEDRSPSGVLFEHYVVFDTTIIRTAASQHTSWLQIYFGPWLHPILKVVYRVPTTLTPSIT